MRNEFENGEYTHMDCNKILENISKYEKYLLTEIFKNDPDTLNDFIGLCKNNDNISIIINRNIKLLTDIQQIVIKLYFGFNDENKHYTLRSISEILNRSTVRVQQIKQNSIRLLRYNLTRLLKYKLPIESITNDVIPDSTKSINKLSSEELKKYDINMLNLPSRMYNALKRKNINIIQDILDMNVYDLMIIRNFGTKSIHTLLTIMETFGFNEWVAIINLKLEDVLKHKNTSIIYTNASKFKSPYLFVFGLPNGEYNGDSLDVRYLEKRYE